MKNSDKSEAKLLRDEDKKSKKAFNYLVRMARRKGALVEVKYLTR